MGSYLLWNMQDIFLSKVGGAVKRHSPRMGSRPPMGRAAAHRPRLPPAATDPAAAALRAAHRRNLQRHPTLFESPRAGGSDAAPPPPPGGGGNPLLAVMSARLDTGLCDLSDAVALGRPTPRPPPERVSGTARSRAVVPRPPAVTPPARPRAQVRCSRPVPPRHPNGSALSRPGPGVPQSARGPKPPSRSKLLNCRCKAVCSCKRVPAIARRALVLAKAASRTPRRRRTARPWPRRKLCF